MENLIPGEQVRQNYRNQGRVQQYLKDRKILSGQLCFDSKLELCDHTYCVVVWDLLERLTIDLCITCYHVKDQCRCDRDRDLAKYPDNE